MRNWTLGYSGWRLVIACLVAAAAIAAFGPATAAADNCGGSAGDNQYVDPLGCTPPPNGSGSHTGGSSSNGGGSTSNGGGSTSTAPSSGGTTSFASSSPSTTHSDPTSNTLPFTGFDIWPVVGLGFGLVGAGLLLRRLSRARP